MQHLSTAASGEVDEKEAAAEARANDVFIQLIRAEDYN